MAKRYTDTTIWKKQRWFRKLSPVHKLAWKYITDTCDHAGILKIDFSEFIDDLGLEEFDINDFIKCCNVDFDKKDGKKIIRERIKLIKDGVFWITGFIKFQYESRDFNVNPSIPAIYSALTLLNSYGTLNEGLTKGYFTLSKPYVKGMLRTKDKDKDIIDEEEDEDFPNFKNEGIAPEMFNIFKSYNKKYFHDKDKDFTSCLQMAYKIGHSLGYNKNDVISKNKKEVLQVWERVVLFVLSDKWFSTRALFDLNNEWQRLIQSMNGKFNSNNNTTHSSKDGFIEVPKGIDYDNLKMR